MEEQTPLAAAEVYLFTWRGHLCFLPGLPWLALGRWHLPKAQVNCSPDNCCAMHYHLYARFIPICANQSLALSQDTISQGHAACTHAASASPSPFWDAQ